MRNPPVAFLLSLEYDCVGMREVFHTNDRCTGGERHHENENQTNYSYCNYACNLYCKSVL